MGMVVQHNMNAINAYNRLNANVAGLKKASEKLASGYRINRAGDDAAGLAISEKMRSQIKGLNQAVRNSQDGINMIQTFEGAAQETHSILQRMKELATESANGTYDNTTDRAAIQLEFDHLNDELNQIADTDFNGTIVLNGGEMADGLKVEGNEFDYANLEKQQAAAKAGAPIDLVAKNDYSSKAPELQDANYVGGSVKDDTKAGAAKLWKQAETDKYTAAADSSEIYVKYSINEINADGTVKSYKGEYVDANGNSTGIKYGGTIDETANGGFQDETTGAIVVADTIGAKEGDYVIVKYTKPAGTPQGPTNAGVKDGYKEGTGVTITGWSATAGAGGLEDQVLPNLKVDLEDEVADKWIDDANSAIYQEAIKALDGAKIEITTAVNSTTAGTDNTPTNVKITPWDAANGAAGTQATLAPGNTTGWGLKAALDDSGSFTLTYKGVDIATVTTGAIKSDGTGSTAGVITLNVTVDGQRYSSDEKPNAALVKDKSVPIDKSVSNANAFTNSTARLTYAKNIIIQTGARSKDAVIFSFNYNADKTADMGELKNNLNLSSRADGLNTANLSLADQKSANHAIDQIDKAINKTSMVRASFGAIQNRLEHKITNLTTTSENLTEAESSIRDTDMASEMMNYTKFNILQQAAQSMLAQANQQPQSILQLLG